MHTQHMKGIKLSASEKWLQGFAEHNILTHKLHETHVVSACYLLMEAINSTEILTASQRPQTTNGRAVENKQHSNPKQRMAKGTT